jgi:threonine/homoserine/homoserine lactone efflux protein
LLAKPAQEAARTKGKGLPGAYFSTFLLTLTNPLTIISFAAIFAGMGLASAKGSYGSAGILVLGVFLGSTLWWFILSGGVGLLRGRFNDRWLQWVNRISGGIITAFGIAALISVL